MFKWFLRNERKSLKIKISNNSSFFILIFAISKFRNTGLLHFVVPNFDSHPYLTYTWHIFKWCRNIFSWPKVVYVAYIFHFHGGYKHKNIKNKNLKIFMHCFFSWIRIRPRPMNLSFCVPMRRMSKLKLKVFVNFLLLNHRDRRYHHLANFASMSLVSRS